MSLRVAFLLEYTIGHVTFANMLQRAVAADPSIDATWALLEPGLPNPAIGRYLPPARNYSIQMSTKARTALGRRPRFDAVFVHTTSIALFLPPLMRRIPTVVSTDATPRNIDELAAAYGHREDPAGVERLKAGAIAAVLRSANRLMPWTEWVGRSMIDDYGVEPARIRVIAPGVPITATAERGPGLGNEAGEPLRVLFVGGDFERKGGYELLDALTRLGDRPWQCDLVTKAEVRLPDHLQQPERIRIHRDLNPGDAELAELFARSNVFVLPTRGDTFAWVLLEAMAAGLPVITTRVGGIQEVVSEGDSGFLVPTEDPAAIAARLTELADSPAERAAMGARALERARTRYDADRNGAAILDLIREATITHRPGRRRGLAGPGPRRAR